MCLHSYLPQCLPNNHHVVAVPHFQSCRLFSLLGTNNTTCLLLHTTCLQSMYCYWIKKFISNTLNLPIPRWVFTLAYLAVPVKFLFSLWLNIQMSYVWFGSVVLLYNTKNRLSTNFNVDWYKDRIINIKYLCHPLWQHQKNSSNSDIYYGMHSILIMWKRKMKSYSNYYFK